MSTKTQPLRPRQGGSEEDGFLVYANGVVSGDGVQEVVIPSPGRGKTVVPSYHKARGRHA